MDAGDHQHVISIGERVSYYSETHGAWLDTTVTGHNFVDGRLQSYDLAIKRHAQVSRVRRCADVAEVATPADGGIPEALPAAGSSEMPRTSGSPEGPEGGAVHESLEPDAAELLEEPDEEPDDALSAVLGSEQNESEVDIGTQNDAPSVVSTAIPDDILDNVRHGRRVPRAARLYPPPCYCDCQEAHPREYGPRGPHVRRCQCPMCGHRSVEEGQECHIRVAVDPRFRGLVICTQCSSFCLRFLRG